MRRRLGRGGSRDQPGNWERITNFLGHRVGGKQGYGINPSVTETEKSLEPLEGGERQGPSAREVRDLSFPIVRAYGEVQIPSKEGRNL